MKRLPDFRSIAAKPTSIFPGTLMPQAIQVPRTLEEFLTSSLTPFDGIETDLLVFDKRTKSLVPQVDVIPYLRTAWLHSLSGGTTCSISNSRTRMTRIPHRNPSFLTLVTLVSNTRFTLTRLRPLTSSSRLPLQTQYKTYKEWQLRCGPYDLSRDSTDEELSLQLTRRADHPCILSVGDSTGISSETTRLITKLLQDQYLKLAEESGFINGGATFKTKYHANGTSASPRPTHPGGLWKSTNQSQLSNWSDLMDAHMRPANALFAISEESINAHIAGYQQLSTSRFNSWQYGDFFHAHYERPRVELLSGQRAILWIHIKDASFVPVHGVDLPSKSGHDQKRSLKGPYSLAFQVTLGLRSVGSKGTRPARFELYFDSKDARYLSKYSWPTEFSDDLQSMLVYIKKGYLYSLAKERLVDFASFSGSLIGPQAGQGDRSSTTPKLLVQPNHTTTAPDGTKSRPVLLLYQPSGKFSDAEAITAFESQTSWVVRSSDPTASFSHGTLALSKDALTRNFLLAPLNRLNTITTLAVVTSGIFSTPLIDDSTHVEGTMLVPLSKVLPTMPDKEFTIQPSDHGTTSEPATRRYVYTENVDCSYMGPRSNGEKITFKCQEESSCTTNNVLTIREGAGSAYSVTIEGEVAWKLSRNDDQAEHPKAESAKLILTWKWDVLKWDGVKLQTTPFEDVAASIKVTSEQSSEKVRAWARPDLREEHFREVFRNSLKTFQFDLLKDVSRLLPSSPHYTLGKPVINRKHDFLVELCYGGVEEVDRPTGPSTPANGNGALATNDKYVLKGEVKKVDG
ncbi:hypothetical protein FKP32DRAFT_1048478 [Trametes sanguinea]|nr:hypothetical protein FKP32DRAFT_1048478 [Trametes sanguinea]